MATAHIHYGGMKFDRTLSGADSLNAFIRLHGGNPTTARTDSYGGVDGIGGAGTNVYRYPAILVNRPDDRHHRGMWVALTDDNGTRHMNTGGLR